MIDVSFDFETYSEADLKAVGAWRYAEDPSTEVLCAAISVGEAEPRVWRPGDEFPPELEYADAIRAWNAEFEYAIWLRCCMRRYGWPAPGLDRFRCTMSLAYSFGLPGKLEMAGHALGVHQQKDAEGSRVMLRLCRPRKPTKHNPATRYTRDNAPEDFDKLERYCQQDVRAERAILAALPRRDLPDIEQATYLSTVRQSERGLRIDRERAQLAQAGVAKHKARLEAECTRITGGIRSTQLKPLRDWLYLDGVDLPNMQAQTIEDALEQPMPPDARRLLSIRASLGQTSVSKFDAMLRAVCRDGRVRGMLQYHGAQTGRWAGRLLQLQNIAKPTEEVGTGKGVGERIARLVETRDMFDPELIEVFGDPMAFYSAYVRPMLIASPGHDLLVADFNAIEVRVLAWLADETWLLDAFRSAKPGDDTDCYTTQASDIYDRPVTKADDEERQLGKRVVLGCGYQMAWEKFMATCAKYGSPIDADLAVRAVDSYRGLNRRIVQFWYDMERAALDAVDEPGRVAQCGRIAFRASADWLQMKLPSGRLLSYRKPHLARNRFGKWAVRYYGVNSLTKQWGVQDTYGGRFVENGTQATARDLCRDAILRLEDRGYATLFSSHDEVVSEAPWINANLDAYVRTMSEVPAWAEGCPIAAEGWQGTRYRK